MLEFTAYKLQSTLMDHTHVIDGPKGETFDATADEFHALTKFVPDPAGETT